MREILFKAKSKDNNEWIEGQIIVIDSQCFISTYFTDYQCKIISADGSTIYNLEKFCEVIPETICQYTGLTDRNGVKIFENDVMKNKRGGKGIVKFSKYAEFILDFIGDSFVSSFNPSVLGHYEVIGNIFDEEIKGLISYD